jgi:hypothetical protein
MDGDTGLHTIQQDCRVDNKRNVPAFEPMLVVVNSTSNEDSAEVQALERCQISASALLLSND